MNIEGVNLVSRSPGKKAIEGNALASPENGATLEDFADALRGQKKLLSEANGQAELPGQLQAIDSPHDSGGLLKNAGAQKELAALFEKYLPASYQEYKKNEAADIEASLLALTDDLKTVTLSVVPDEVTTTQDLSSVMVLNGLPFVKPLPGEAKLDSSVEDVASGDFLQTETVFRQPIQDGQSLNLKSLENTESTQKALLPGKQFTPLLELEKAVPGVTTDMLPVQRPADHGTYSPAITKPLTHPGWGKDLGEQIIWMNNKEMSTAEIRLNPANLGPLSVRIDVNQDSQTTIMFTAQHLEAKEAIEASVPKLREMLGTQQLNLVNVNISQNSTPDHGRAQSQTFSKTTGNHGQSVEDDPGNLEKIELTQGVVSKGLLSLYA